MSDEYNMDEEIDTTGAGYSVKKTYSELAELSDEDESLARWKQQLGIKEENFVLESMRLVIPNRPSVTLQLNTPEPHTVSVSMKEKTSFAVTLQFKVNNQRITGLKLKQSIFKSMLRTTSLEEVGDFDPSPSTYNKTVTTIDTPSGMLTRGRYLVKHILTDGNGNTIKQWNWDFELKKEWD